MDERHGGDHTCPVDTGTGFFIRIETGNPVAMGMQINAVESGKNYVQADWDIVYYLQAIPEPSAVFALAMGGVLLLSGRVGRGWCRSRWP